jgi:pimeloyl-ACP methyl ester carboxylesterase
MRGANEQARLSAIAGPTDTFPILFVHGAAWTRSMWLPQMQALSDAIRVFAIDLPGHGVRRGTPFQLASALQLIEETLKQETEEQHALIVGLSLGGYVVMTYAHAYPHDVAGLILSGCSIDYRGAIGLLS